MRNKFIPMLCNRRVYAGMMRETATPHVIKFQGSPELSKQWLQALEQSNGSRFLIPAPTDTTITPTKQRPIILRHKK